MERGAIAAVSAMAGAAAGGGTEASPRRGLCRRGAAAALLRAAVAGGVAVLATACGVTDKYQSGSGPQPLRSPAAVLNPPRNVPQDVEEITVEVSDKGFDADRYNVQPGAIRIRFVGRGGGAHSVRIEKLMDARLVPADGTEVVGLTATPGEYTMQLDGGAIDTAIFNVRPIGGR